MLIVSSKLRIPDEELELTFSRSSGPGGQNVNKVNSKATLRWNAAASPSLDSALKERLLRRLATRLTGQGALVIHSQRYRDQPRNIEDCREKLCQLLAAALTEPKPRKKVKPGRAAKARRLQDKRDHAQKKARRAWANEEH